MFDQMRKSLRLKPEIVTESQKLLEEVKETMKKRFQVDDLVFVGLHIRRTDSIQYHKSRYNEEEIEAEFFNRAMEVYR